MFNPNKDDIQLAFRPNKIDHMQLTPRLYTKDTHSTYRLNTETIQLCNIQAEKDDTQLTSGPNTYYIRLTFRPNTNGIQLTYRPNADAIQLTSRQNRNGIQLTFSPKTNDIQ